VTVNGVSQPTGNELLQPDAGQKFIAVDVTLVNQGSTAEAISTLMQMAVKDSSGKKYDVDLGAQASTGGSNGTLDGMLAPGDEVRGDVAFSVPANMTNSALVFIFTPGLVGTPVTFSLGG
ncbi:MAG TPA: DUF4352 domain-containing protein, partial [Thermomicrobiaceae bacterium]|nr:DUF4352 domain-containing protein [Thermomicrobiaceae bacterium]